MFKFLLKKELKDITYSYKTILLLLICSFIPFVLFEEKSVWVEVLFIQMLVGQFMYDSYLLDIKKGGIYFIINRKISFFYYFLIKFIISMLFSFIPMIVNIKFLISNLSVLNLLWIILSLPYCNSIMFIASIISKGEEIVTALFVTALYVLILLLLSKVFIVAKFCIVIIIDIVSVIILLKFSKSFLFRKQIN